MKKIVSILLVLILALNIFGCLFTVHAAAVAETVVTYIVAPAVMGLLASALGTTLVNVSTAYSDKVEVTNRINSQAIVNGELMQVKCTHYTASDTYSYELVPVDGLTGDTAEEVNFICDYMNGYGHINTAIAGFMLENGDNVQNIYHGDVKAEVYEQLKTDATNAFTAYLECKQRGIDISNEEDAMTALAADLGTTWSPAYEFSFTGPLTSAQLLGQHGFVSDTISKDGFVLYPVHVANIDNNGAFFTEADALSFAGGYGTVTSNNPANPSNKRWYVSFSHSSSVVKKGYYIIYNGTAYYYLVNWGNSTSIGFSNDPLTFTSTTSYYDINGNCLSSVLSTENNKVSGLMVGAVYNVSGENTLPGVTTDDFTFQTEDTDVSIPYTEDEAAVRAAVLAQIISQNPDLTIDENGNIVAADNISLAQLEQIAQQIADGQMQFEDFEEYLSYIAGLLMKANVNTGTITDVLNGLRTYEQQQTNALNQINANIASISAAFAASSAITADKTFDIDTPSSIIDKFPFSLPFDVYRVFNLLSAEPVAPHWTFDLEMEGVYDFPIEIDLSDYEWIANIVRWLVYAAFVVGLILVTNKLIGRG